jgi:hypothetical protein
MGRRFYSYVENGYEFKCYYGNFQKLKYDSKKEDYYVTYEGEKYYLNECIRTGAPWTENDRRHDKEFNVMGSWQEGYTVYELQCKDTTDFCEDSPVRVVYCPPSSHYVGI